MHQNSKIYWALNRRRYPQMVAAAMQMKRLGIKLDQDWERFIEDSKLDAAEALGCEPNEIAPEKIEHIDMMSQVITSYFNDVIDSSGAVDTRKSTSSYLQG